LTSFHGLMLCDCESAIGCPLKLVRQSVPLISAHEQHCMILKSRYRARPHENVNGCCHAFTNRNHYTVYSIHWLAGTVPI